eukprot:1455031-Rhodomonas_salina.3
MSVCFGFDFEVHCSCLGLSMEAHARGRLCGTLLEAWAHLVSLSILELAGEHAHDVEHPRPSQCLVAPQDRQRRELITDPPWPQTLASFVGVVLSRIGFPGAGRIEQRLRSSAAMSDEERARLGLGREGRVPESRIMVSN